LKYLGSRDTNGSRLFSKYWIVTHFPFCRVIEVFRLLNPPITSPMYFSWLKRIFAWKSLDDVAMSIVGINNIMAPLGYDFEVSSYIVLNSDTTSSFLDFSADTNNIFVFLLDAMKSPTYTSKIGGESGLVGFQRRWDMIARFRSSRNRKTLL
jgi:hypothetical protein